MSQRRLRLPRPGLPGRRHGPGAGRRLAGRGRGLRRGRRGARRADQPARLRGPGRGARPDRERPAGAPGDVDRLSRGAPRALGRPRHRASEPGVRGRPFDGPVQRARRGRRPRPRATGSASSASAAARCRRPGRAGTARWPRSSASTTRASRSSSREASAHGVFGVANRNAPGQVVVSGERPAIEAGAEIAKRARGAEGDRPAGLGRRPLAAHGRGGRGDARRSSPASSSPTRTRRCSPTPTPACSRPRTPAATELVEHLTPGVDWVAASERMTAEGVDDVRRGRARARPDRPDQANRPRRRGRRARRPGAPDRLAVPAAPEPPA